MATTAAVAAATATAATEATASAEAATPGSTRRQQVVAGDRVGSETAATSGLNGPAAIAIVDVDVHAL